MKLTNLTEKQNKEFNELLEKYDEARYWEAEGYTEQHKVMIAPAKENLARFLNSVIPNQNENT